MTGAGADPLAAPTQDGGLHECDPECPGTALAKMELSNAVPIEPPTCGIVFTAAEATPASVGTTP